MSRGRTSRITIVTRESLLGNSYSGIDIREALLGKRYQESATRRDANERSQWSAKQPLSWVPIAPEDEVLQVAGWGLSASFTKRSVKAFSLAGLPVFDHA